MHERLLGVDVFVVLQRMHHGRGVVEVGHVHDHGVEIGDLVGEGFAIIAHRPGVGMFLLDLVDLAAVHVAEAGPFDHRMAFQAAALEAADAADADLEDAQLAVLVDLGPRGQREGRKAGGDDGAGLEKAPASDGRE